MDLTRFKQVYPDFLKLLEDRGYSKSTIGKYQWIINRFLSEGSSPKILTFEDYFIHLRKHLSESSLPEVCTYIGTMKYYVEHGIFHRDSSFRNGFMSHSSYDSLNPYYKSLVDYSQAVLAKKYSRNTIIAARNAASVFCSYLTKHGFKSFENIKKQATIIEYFNDGKNLLHCSAHSYSLSLFLSSCTDTYPICSRILSLLPKVKRWKKNYDSLTNEEKLKIKGVLTSDELTMREKAIGNTLYYTGLRSSDVAGLCLDDIDLDQMLIIIRSQKKTGEPLTLPLQKQVRDSICSYVENERPKTDDEHIFITKIPPYRGMTPGSLNNITSKIMDKAAVRVESGRRGTHIFRHAMASDLICANVPKQYVSKLLGHTSLSSLDSYIDADIEHMRQCGLNIKSFQHSTSAQAIFSPYMSGAAEVLNDITSVLVSAGKLTPYAYRSLRHIDDFCCSLFPCKQLSQDILDAWSYPVHNETAKSYDKRMGCLDILNKCFESYNLHIEQRDSPITISRQHYQSDFVSPCRQLFTDYVAFQKSALRWNRSYDYALKDFDASCRCSDGNGVLCQEAIDLWSRQRDTESLASCGKRTAFLSGLCNYTNNIYGTNLVPPKITTRSNTTHMPHIYTKQELNNFFIACDHIARMRKSKTIELRSLTVPAIFRLMYSSGLRTNEVRMLDCDNVDLLHGIINITHTKGLNEHRVALHDSMREYLISYDRRMDSIMPKRKCFFPNIDDKYYSSTWINWNFECMWYSYNDGYSVPYDLRHNYAIENINSWPAERELFDANLVYLSRSMGHSSIDETMYYYAFTPQLAKIITERKASTFSDIIGNANCFDIERP